MDLARDNGAGDALCSPTDVAYVDRVVRLASSSFYWGMRSLPPQRRQAIYAVYAFCREVDDIADEDGPLAAKRERLAAWRAEIDLLYDWAPTRPITRVLAGPISVYGLDRADFLAIIDGMEMDAGAPIRAPSRDDLMLYCDRVACAVGRLCVRIFGETGEAGRRTADALGRALQLTNILRDVHEDAERGRLYFPHELLSRHGVNGSEPAEIVDDPAFVDAWHELAAEAREAFAESEAALADCDATRVRPARIMMEAYRRTLDRLEAAATASGRVPRRPQPGSLRHFLDKAERLLIAVRHGWS